MSSKFYTQCCLSNRPVTPKYGLYSYIIRAVLDFYTILWKPGHKPFYFASFFFSNTKKPLYSESQRGRRSERAGLCGVRKLVTEAKAAPLELIRNKAKVPLEGIKREGKVCSGERKGGPCSAFVTPGVRH